jgi:hypothetical protein
MRSLLSNGQIPISNLYWSRPETLEGTQHIHISVAIRSRVHPRSRLDFGNPGNSVPIGLNVLGYSPCMTRLIAPFPDVVLAPFTQCVEDGLFPILEEGIAHDIVSRLPYISPTSTIVVFQIVDACI